MGPHSVVIQDVLPYSTTVGKREIGVFGANRVGLERRGFLAPVITGWVLSLRGSFADGFLLMTALALSSVLVVLLFHHPDRDREGPVEKTTSP